MLNPLAIFTVVCFVVEIRCSRELCYKKKKKQKKQNQKKKKQKTEQNNTNSKPNGAMN